MHIPVLLNEVVESMGVVPGGSYIDGTLGQAGHASAIMKLAGENGRLLGIDRDDEALLRAKNNLREVPGSHTLVNGEHGQIKSIAIANGFENANGILLDLGVSSDQLDTPERGFSFRFDGPLDMRMNRLTGETAADLVNRLTETELVHIFRTFGEEPQAGRIARAILKMREKKPFVTTMELAELIRATVGGKKGGKHPATRVFQALRMAVNHETDDLVQALRDGLDLLAPNGRMVIITFESLTDRIVKTFFKEHAGRMVSLQQGGEKWEGSLPRVQQICKKALIATTEEIEKNPRARSAKVRAVRKMEN